MFACICLERSKKFIGLGYQNFPVLAFLAAILARASSGVFRGASISCRGGDAGAAPHPTYVAAAATTATSARQDPWPHPAAAILCPLPLPQTELKGILASPQTQLALSVPATEEV